MPGQPGVVVQPAGSVTPFVENSVRLFRCPDGFDRTPGSPTRGAYFQISYAINGVAGGPQGVSLIHITNGNGTSNVMFGWEHSRHPGCATMSRPCAQSGGAGRRAKSSITGVSTTS